MEGQTTNAFTTFDPLITLLEIYPKDKFAVVQYTCYILNYAIIYLYNKMIDCTMICKLNDCVFRLISGIQDWS